jgi:hypothetical protein
MTQQEYAMKLIALAALLTALTAAASSAFADTSAPQQGLTRAEVRAQLAQAYRTGDVGRLNKVSYPDQSMASRDLIRAQNHTHGTKHPLLNRLLASE